MQLVERRNRAIAAIAAIALIAAAWTLIPRTAHAATTSTRVAGADRYATSVAISRWTFPNEHPEVAYIAAGTSAADALSGAPVAARDGAPLLLVAPKAVPQSVADELIGLTAAFRYSLRNRAQETVDDEHGVERQ